ncbi:MAG: hypothetical protein KDA60_11060 [Planctomycetales bacterium]|nr:hypothetical protein [Planctomycetales bacterium]
MFRRIMGVACLLGLFAFTSTLEAETLLFDFGNDSTISTGNVNNVVATAQSVSNAIDDTGAMTGINLTVDPLLFFNEIGGNGSGPNPPDLPVSALFPTEMAQDSLFGHTDNFNVGAPRPFVQYTIDGLDGSGATGYSFIFFAGRLGVGDFRQTQYDVIGRTAETTYLEVANNTGTEFAVIPPVVPNPAGQLTLTVQPGPENTNGSGFFYLGAMRIDSVPVPEPAAGGMLLLGILSLIGARRGWGF